MYLERLEIQGFKTFAKKTTLHFIAPKTDRHALTVVVGPNGSGKSNIADAIRWCLGEQSMKLLRGKKSEDIIFSGSTGKARSGMAEVIMTINNADKVMPVAYEEVVIARRLYRDGESEYLLNGKPVRLADVQLLLAQAGVGQRSYSVIGQGMIDHVLTASPEERKIFFDDATGVRGLQIKRHQSMLKLQKASENLAEVEMLLQEISPRLRSLKRQVSRLEKRESVESELREVQDHYFGARWHGLQAELRTIEAKDALITQRLCTKQEELKKGDLALIEFEKQQSAPTDHTQRTNAHEAYKTAQTALHRARQEEFEAQRALELSKVKAQSTWSPLPLHSIISEMTDISHEQKLALTELKRVTDLAHISPVIKRVDALFEKTVSLKNKLVKPATEDFKPDPSLLNAVDMGAKAVKGAQDKLKQAEHELDQANKAATPDHTELFTLQRSLRELQNAIHHIEQEVNQCAMERVRAETRLEGLEQEMTQELREHATEIKSAPAPMAITPNTLEQWRERMFQLKHQLELIGGIDEETIAEFEQTRDRHAFLDAQVTDIRKAIASTEKIIDELDSTISTQSEKVFKEINKEFQKYFKLLFGGGSCGLLKLKQEEVEKQTKVNLDRAMEALAEEKIEEEEEDEHSVGAIMKRVKQRKDHVAGIEIQATPPGKRLKALNLLSGGERALTSIALLSAIMATNPSPFVVLDEVDAALDEANTVRFANILDELRKLTQFIVVTHNRATMERADLLYGVSMGSDGISNLLSVKLEDIEENGTARR